jgi:hypothetical protein
MTVRLPHLKIKTAAHLLELRGKDLRRSPLEERKRELAKLLRKAKWALQLNEHIDEPGDVVFKHACKPRLRGYRVEAIRLAISRR